MASFVNQADRDHLQKVKKYLMRILDWTNTIYPEIVRGVRSEQGSRKPAIAKWKIWERVRRIAFIESLDSARAIFKLISNPMNDLALVFL